MSPRNAFLKQRPNYAARVLPITIALLMGGCAQGGLETAALPLAQSDTSAPAVAQQTASTTTASVAKEPDVQLNPETATKIKEARALRTDGKKADALALLDKAPDADKDPALLKERGLTALELGQVDRAKDLLTKAQSSGAPDWRVHSALGAALSAGGNQKEAQAEFAKALALSPDQPSVMNNLALSYALDGKHDDAELLLRRAVIAPESEPKTKQNLALVLGLKGNLDESRKISSMVLSPQETEANVAYLEKLKSGNSSVSKAETVTERPIQAASYTGSTDVPIMQLGGPQN